MKKVILAVGLFTSSVLNAIGDPKLTVTKKDGGLFGYKSVTEVNAPEQGMHTLSCFDPGRTRCRTNGLVVLNNGNSLSSDELDQIDRIVDEQVITLRKESGTIVFANKAEIIFSYSPENHQLVYSIFAI